MHPAGLSLSDHTIFRWVNKKVTGWLRSNTDLRLGTQPLRIALRRYGPRGPCPRLLLGCVSPKQRARSFRVPAAHARSRAATRSGGWAGDVTALTPIARQPRSAVPAPLAPWAGRALIRHCGLAPQSRHHCTSYSFHRDKGNETAGQARSDGAKIPLAAQDAALVERPQLHAIAHLECAEQLDLLHDVFLRNMVINDASPGYSSGGWR